MNANQALTTELKQRICKGYCQVNNQTYLGMSRTIKAIKKSIPSFDARKRSHWFTLCEKLVAELATPSEKIDSIKSKAAKVYINGGNPDCIAGYSYEFSNAREGFICQFGYSAIHNRYYMQYGSRNGARTWFCDWNQAEATFNQYVIKKYGVTKEENYNHFTMQRRQHKKYA